MCRSRTCCRPFTSAHTKTHTHTPQKINKPHAQQRVRHQRESLRRPLFPCSESNAHHSHQRYMSHSLHLYTSHRHTKQACEKDIYRVLQILQVPFDAAQRVPQLRGRPFRFGGGGGRFAQLAPAQVQAAGFVQRLEDITGSRGSGNEGNKLHTLHTLLLTDGGGGRMMRPVGPPTKMQHSLLHHKEGILQRHDIRNRVRRLRRCVCVRMFCVFNVYQRGLLRCGK